LSTNHDDERRVDLNEEERKFKESTTTIFGGRNCLFNLEFAKYHSDLLINRGFYANDTSVGYPNTESKQTRRENSWLPKEEMLVATATTSGQVYW
jgi:hypothetical protein